MNKPTLCQRPQRKNPNVTPCQRPIKTMVATCVTNTIAGTGKDRSAERRERVSGLKKYDLNHWVKVICQEFQNWVRFGLKYGESKFSGRRKPSSRPKPIAISV